MKNLNNIFLKRMALVVVPLLIWTSCRDEEAEELKLSRRFKPAIFDISSGETAATIQWRPSLFALPGEVEYQLELSKTNDFSSIEYTLTTTSSLVTILDTDIAIREDHFARVKAIGQSNMGDSHWLVSEPFQITGEIFILPISESDVVVNEAVIHWLTEDVITSVLVTPQGGTPVEVLVTAEEAAAGEKILSGLIQNTQYTAEIRKSGVPKGSVSFRTKPSWEDAHIIDLTGIAGKASILADTLPDIPSGSVVLLKRGETYEISTHDLDRSVTFTSGADFVPGFATIRISSSFNILAASSIDSLVFRDLNITGDDFAGDYAFNINREGSITRVRFDNVRAHRLRGLFRMQTGGAGTKVQDFIVNNCVIDSLREYGIAWTNGSNAFANIRITNSTVYSARRVISHSSPGSNSIVIANCTFNDAPSGGPEGAEPNYFIDLAGNPSANPIMITNTIIGRGWNEGAGNHVRGIRAGAGTTANVANSYSTSDYLSTNASFQISGLLAYPAASTSLFANAGAGDFTIVDSGFPGAGSAGDPRWRE